MKDDAKDKTTSAEKLDSIVAENRRYQDERAKSYRERALNMYPWICGRCTREFIRKNLSELTVHHRDHNHDNNPEDGSNWELLCLYCHDNEHQRLVEANGSGEDKNKSQNHTSNPFADLKEMMKQRK